MTENNNIFSRLSSWSIGLIALTIPFNLRLNSYSIAACIVIHFWGFISGKIKFRYSRKNILLVLFASAYYLIEIVSLLYSDNLEKGTEIVLKKSSLLLLPLLLGFIKNIKTSLIYFCFIASNLLACIFMIFFSLKNYFSTNDMSSLIYENLSSTIDAHPTYISMHIVFATILLLFYNNWNSNSINISPVLKLFGLTIFTLVVLSLSSRTAVVTLLVSYLTYGILLIVSKKINNTVIFTALFFFITLFIIGFYKLGLKQRFNEILSSSIQFDPNTNNANGLTLRAVKWNCSLNGITNNPLFGIGVGDAQDYLQKCYSNKGFWGVHYAYNSHNQFLQIGLASGLVSLLLFISYIIFVALKLISSKNHMELFFYMSIVLFCMTESILERQHGVVFFSFFNAIFLSNLQSDK